MWLGCKASLIPYTLPRDSYKNQEGNSRYHYKSCNYQKDNNGLNQIAYDYTVELTNRFKGLDLIDRVHEELCTEVCDTVQEARGIKTTPKKKKCKKAKWLSEEAFQIAVKRREASEKQRRKGKIYPCECSVPKKMQGEIRKPSSMISARNRGKQ